MKKLTYLLLVLLLAALIGAGCTQSTSVDEAVEDAAAEPGDSASEPAESEAAASEPEAESSSEPIKLGNVQDLTGPNKAFGLGMTNAAEVYIENVNAEGGVCGRQIEFISYDTKSEVNEAINAYRRLGQQDQVVAAIGPPIANMGLALAPISEEVEVPMVGLYMDERAMVSEEGELYDFMFLAQNPSGSQARTIAQYALNELQPQTVGMLYNTQNAYSAGLAEAFKEFINEQGVEIVAEETYTNADKDYRAQLTNIKQANPDVIYMPLYPAEIPLGLQQAHELGIDVPILGDNSYIPFALASNTDPAASANVYFPYGIDPNDPELADWAAAYTERFGYPPVAQAYSGEDAIGVLLEAIGKTCNDLSASAIAGQIAAVENYDGLQGPVTISAENHMPVTLPMAILTVEEGAPMLVDWYTEVGPIE